MRQAIVHYRALFSELLEVRPEPRRDRWRKAARRTPPGSFVRPERAMANEEAEAREREIQRDRQRQGDMERDRQRDLERDRRERDR